MASGDRSGEQPLSITGRGAALLRALEQPVRRPGQLSAHGLSPQIPSTIYSSQSQPLSFSPSSQPPFHRQATPTQMAPTIQPTMSLGGMGGNHVSVPPPIQPTMSYMITPTAQPPQPVSHASRASQSPTLSRPPELTPPIVPKSLGRGDLLKLIQTKPRMPNTASPTSLATPPHIAMSQMTLQSTTTPPTQTNDQTSTSSPPVAAPLNNGATKQGSSGNSIPLGANYLVVHNRIDNVFQYCITYSPPIESRNMRYAMLNEHKDLIGQTRAFDGSTLFLPIKITDTTITRMSKRSTDGAEITIFIKLTNILHYSECTQLFNVIIRRVLRCLELQQVGRQYYDSHHPIPVPQHKMELWPGYVTSIHQFDGGLLLLLDVSHKLLRMDTALDFFYELYSKSQDRFQDEATRQLVGTIVLTRYNNRTYRIDDIAWDKTPQSTFIDHTGKAVSFIEYYKKAYDREIQDTEQPLLLHRPKRRRIPIGRGRGSKARATDEEEPEEVICLVPELCSMTGLTDNARNDFKVMKDLAVHTRITPNQREVAIKKFIRTVNNNDQAKKELESWGLSLQPNLLQTTGRRLNSERIFFKDNSTVAGLDAEWSRELVKEHVITAVALKTWLLVFAKRDSSKAMDFMSMMKKVCPPMGIEVRDAIIVELPNDRTESYIRAIREQVNSKLQLVVIIFPTSRDDRYSSIKKLCCIESPIPSQVINARTISQQQKLRSVTQKVALQINVKLGGELWAVEIPVKNIMVIGIDVYHDNAHGKRSILGFVNSTNKYFTRWYSRVSIQDKNQEIADGLKLCFQSALRNYHELNQSLPERIIVFRDGVGDGQMGTVAEFEVPQFKSCLSMFGEDYRPRMAVVVVQKRISTRMFAQGSQGYENPSPGTIMDHTITRKGWYDFFLVSQHVRQGTVTPTHYNVVFDTSGLKPDHMQRLAYKLTHMYYNWPGTIRVPAPCQYAHKLAFLVGQSLHKEPSKDISDRLFFL